MKNYTEEQATYIIQLFNNICPAGEYDPEHREFVEKLAAATTPTVGGCWTSTQTGELCEIISPQKSLSESGYHAHEPLTGDHYFLTTLDLLTNYIFNGTDLGERS